ncbi:MAG TPA: tape measure protein [Siphovirus UK_ancient_CT89]|nr:MAG TPA: tape measure protein [Siphovirus UK_ancient_CT89]
MDSLTEKMSQGKISSEMLSQALQWATQEGGQFYKGAEIASNTLEGRVNKMYNSLSEMAVNIFSAISPILNPLVSFATQVIDTVGSGIVWLIDKFKEGNPIVIGLAATIGTLSAAVLAYKTVVGIITLVQNGFTLAVMLSNMAILANPIVWVSALVVGLVAGIILAWKKFEGFRGAIYGVWEVIKGFGKILKDFVIDRIKGLLEGIGGMGKAISLLFSGKFGQAWEMAKLAAKNISGLEAVQNAVASTKNLGEAYAKGREKGIAAFMAEKQQKENQKKASEEEKMLEEATNTKLLEGIKSNISQNNGLSQANMSTAAAGGPTVVNITIGKFLDNINISPQTLQEGINNIEALILEMFGRVVVQGGYAQ